MAISIEKTFGPREIMNSRHFHELMPFQRADVIRAAYELRYMGDKTLQALAKSADIQASARQRFVYPFKS